MTLLHYTCAHVRQRLGRRAMLRPQRQPHLGDRRLLWLTEQAVPDRLALGLTSQSLDCDRLQHRYLVDTLDAEPWLAYAQRTGLPPDARARLEAVDGAQPSTWWVLETSALGVLDRAYAGAPR